MSPPPCCRCPAAAPPLPIPATSHKHRGRRQGRRRGRRWTRRANPRRRCLWRRRVLGLLAHCSWRSRRVGGDLSLLKLARAWRSWHVCTNATLKGWDKVHILFLSVYYSFRSAAYLPPWFRVFKKLWFALYVPDKERLLIICPSHQFLGVAARD